MTAKVYYIYQITHLPSQKKYIGQTLRPTQRWTQHCRHARQPEKTKQYLHYAMAAYGLTEFKFVILNTCDTRAQANELESLYISQFNTCDKNFGYNMRPGGAVRGQWQHSLETKQKISASHRRLNRVYPSQSIESIEKRRATLAAKYGTKICQVPNCGRTDGYKFEGIRYCSMHVRRLRTTGTWEKAPRIAYNKGQKQSPEFGQKVSQALKGKMMGRNNAFYGRHHTPENKEKLRQLNLGREPPNKKYFPPEILQAIQQDPRSLRQIARAYQVSTKVIVRIKKIR